MDKLVIQYQNMQKRASLIHDEITKKFGLPSGTLPVGGFYGIEQLFESTAIVFNFYDKDWKNTDVSTAPLCYRDKLQQERAAQAQIIARGCFIEILSCIEYCAVQAVKNAPDVHQPQKAKQKVYLKELFAKSVTAGWIPSADQESWNGLIELRNALVHRNGISDKNISFKITNAFALRFADGHVITAKLPLYAELKEWAIEGFARWCAGYLHHVQAQGWSSLARV